MRAYEFGPFHLDAAERRLLRDGTVVPMTAKTFDTLLLLVRNAGRLVTKKAVMESVWSDRFVDEGNVAQHISMIRRALGDFASSIETVPAHGYRFIAVVREVDSASDAPAGGAGGDAYRAYLRGRIAWSKRTAEGLRNAIQHFSDAIEADPLYARAYAGLADSYSQLAWMRVLPPREAFPTGRAAAVRALELDPRLAEAHASMAWIQLVYDWNAAASEESFAKAIALDRSCLSARIWSSVLFSAVGRFDDALDAIQAAKDIDPLSPLASTLCGWPHYFRGDYDRALARYNIVLEAHPNHLPSRILRAHLWMVTDQPERAVEDAEAAVRIDDTAFSRAAYAEALARAKRTAQAEQIVGALREKRTFVCPYDLAAIAMARGDHDAALDALEEAHAVRSSWLFLAGVEPRFAPLRASARFRRVRALEIE